MVTKEQLKKEFDSFARGVSQLEALRKELNSLDSSGFELEVKSIRVKLKDIHEISEVKKEIVLLKKRIAKRGSDKVVHVKRSTSQAKNLRKKIEKLEKRRAKKQLSKSQVSSISEIPKIEKELSSLKKSFKEHSSSANIRIDSGVGVLVDSKFDDFVRNLKGELSQKLKQRKLDLSKEMEQGLAKKKKEFSDKYSALVKEQHEKYKERVDNELAREVKRRFERELDNGLAKERNRIISELIKEDAKRLNFERKNLTRKLHEHYSKKEKEFDRKIVLEKKKLKESLAKVKKMRLKNASHRKAFNEYKQKQLSELVEMISEEKKRIAEIERTKLREIENLKKKQNSRVKERSNLLERRMKLLDRTEKKDKEIIRNKLRELKEKDSQRSKWIEEEKNRLQKFAKLKRDSLDKRLGELKKHEEEDKKEISGEKEKLKVSFGELKKEFEMLKEAERERHERTISAERRKMLLNVRAEKANLANQLEEKIEKMRKENDRRLEIGLEEREKLLRKKLDVEYRDKMEVAIRSKMVEIEKKKLELEKHIIAQAKRIFD